MLLILPWFCSSKGFQCLFWGSAVQQESSLCLFSYCSFPSFRDSWFCEWYLTVLSNSIRHLGARSCEHSVSISSKGFSSPAASVAPFSQAFRALWGKVLKVAIFQCMKALKRVASPAFFALLTLWCSEKISFITSLWRGVELINSGSVPPLNLLESCTYNKYHFWQNRLDKTHLKRLNNENELLFPSVISV